MRHVSLVVFCLSSAGFKKYDVIVEIDGRKVMAVGRLHWADSNYKEVLKCVVTRNSQLCKLLVKPHPALTQIHAL